MKAMRNESLLVAATEPPELEDFMRRVARAPASALLLDYDGTLAPFAANRQQAFPFKGVPALLQAIMVSGRSRVVIITGRNAYEVVFFLRIEPIPEVWGSHGLQRLHPDGSCEMPHVDPAVSRGLSEVSQWLALQGLQRLTEFKPGGIAIHWRGLSESSALQIHDKVSRAWTPIAERTRLSMLEFDGGIEIRVPNLDKGDAVRTIMEEMDPDIPIAYLGDDITDERAFCALGSRGISILVRPEWRQTSAQLWLKPPEGVLQFLTQWKQACSRDGRSG
jgi:trehalose 6-phosphate phosphatase